MTFQGWVTRPLKGRSGDPSTLGHVTPQGWVTRHPKGGSRDPSRVGPGTGGRLVVGSMSAYARPTHTPETNQPRLGEKPSPGASPCSPKRKGGLLYAGKNRGIFAVVGMGRRGLGVCLQVRQVLAHRAQVSQPHGATGPLIAGIRSPSGVKGRLGHSPGERGRLALRQPPGKSPAQAPDPQVFPAHTVSEELGELLGSVAHGKSRGSLGGREGCCVHGQVPRDPVELL